MGGLSSGLWLELGASGLVLIVGAAIELRTGHVPNWLTLPAIGASFFVGLVGLDWKSHALGLLLALFVYYLAFRNQAVGGGAVKLAAAVAGLGGISVALGVVAVVAMAALALRFGPERFLPKSSIPGFIGIAIGWALGAVEAWAAYEGLLPWSAGGG